MGAGTSASPPARTQQEPLLVQLLRQGSWYVAAGAGATAVHALLFLLLREPLGTYPANLTAIAIATVANTEFHHHITFNARGSPKLRRAIAIVVTICFYATYSSAALLALQTAIDNPTATQQTATIITAAMLFGVARFTLLRVWVFAHTRRSRIPRDQRSG
ncbi:GtrA family protein [Haloechinothrix sp. LS1_15]|uniref:GtrA family protein n=1 Tax=Haloechinothrix sp. LS1_15 TaxID=2652248 RepID=UPI002945B19E|nr:GtrA family protein [Haloechinothrix sp. LS1_15]MDV6013712.1 GtrA family protein [Haloechinothrix sp. LS1_15]